eukprot:TRINITY_DN1257_c0_g1_i1.p1 TRINITY_DN1257_c0_g1~~TRINITY_DN1257_c0_g1_i1.p1  ORF type:complete len:1024 (-),score=211.29 TRINITY_DN1257_c0_g1_i1:198-3269(-)
MFKQVQKSLHTLLSTEWGKLLCVLCFLATFFSCLQISEVFTNSNCPKELPMVKICNEEIDIVYTWVNGTDPKLLREIEEVKFKLDPTAEQVVACRNGTNDKNEKCSENDSASKSRFIDNEELRYSLRSIEKNAPWIRHIYLVTNGQIPYWLNLEHPKLTVIQHSDIFLNKNHLPTFSSPAIESHIHRIPGLSNKFLYLNDDVMFGREIYLDDFYTKSKGQKVFLSWAVPTCADGCPHSWLGDKYCDNVCNTTLCGYDEGDCLNANYTSRTRGWSGSRTTTPSSFQSSRQAQAHYCQRTCPDSWIGDKYCDNTCKTLECAFDGGDCGAEIIFSSMHGVSVANNTRLIELPDNVPAVYLNLSLVVPDQFKITEGSHDNPELVRTATIIQRQNVMTLTFHRNITRQDVLITLTSSNGSYSTEYSFNLTASTSDSLANSSSSDPSLLSLPSSDSLASHGLRNQSIVNDSSVDAVLNVTHEILTAPKNENSSLVVGENKTPITNQSSQETDSLVSPPVSIQNDSTLESLLINTIELITNSTTNSTTNQSFNQTITNNPTPRKIVKANLVDGTVREAIQNQNQQQPHSTSTTSSSSSTSTPLEQSRKLLSMEEPEVSLFFSPRTKERIPIFVVKDRPLPSTENMSKKESKSSSLSDLRQKKEEKAAKQKLKSETQEMAEKESLESLQRLFENEPEPQQYPWEALAQYASQQTHKKEGVLPYQTRKLLDTFGDSLRYVDRLYSNEFGYSQRKVPAHMPHLIDRTVLTQLQERWPELWDLTSSHQLRSSYDMQYSFSYFYYLVHQKTNFEPEAIWFHQLDVDHDGVLNNYELRNLAVLTYGADQAGSHLQNMTHSLLNSSMSGVINYQSLVNNPVLFDKLAQKTKSKSKNKYELTGTDDVAFLMIRESVQKTQKSLDGIREGRHRFICLNDNLNHSDPTTRELLNVIHDFYLSLFPQKSEFELPDGVENEYLYIDEMRNHMGKKDILIKSQGWSKAWVFFGMVGLVVVLFLFVSRRRHSPLQLTPTSPDHC